MPPRLALFVRSGQVNLVSRVALRSISFIFLVGAIRAVGLGVGHSSLQLRLGWKITQDKRTGKAKGLPPNDHGRFGSQMIVPNL